MSKEGGSELRPTLEEIEQLLGDAARLDPLVAELARELRSVESERMDELLRVVRSDPAGLRNAQSPPGADAERILKE